jgi:hypothetical protein
MKSFLSTYRNANSVQFSPPKNIEPFQYRPVDAFAPKSSAYIRPKSRCEKVECLSSPRETPVWNSLRDFAFKDAKKDISSLKSEVPYNFSFARDFEPVPHIIRFNGLVLIWMNKHKAEAKIFIDAINMGRARAFGQAGIKKVLAREGFYEVKIKGDDRLILRLSSGTFEAILVTDKDDFDRDVLAIP